MGEVVGVGDAGGGVGWSVFCHRVRDRGRRKGRGRGGREVIVSLVQVLKQEFYYRRIIFWEVDFAC